MRGELYITYRSIEAGVIVNIDKARSAGIEAGTDERIILSEVGGVEGTGFGTTCEELPSDRETEGIEAVVIYEVCHLALSVAAY